MKESAHRVRGTRILYLSYEDADTDISYQLTPIASASKDFISCIQMEQMDIGMEWLGRDFHARRRKARRSRDKTEFFPTFIRAKQEPSHAFARPHTNTFNPWTHTYYEPDQELYPRARSSLPRGPLRAHPHPIGQRQERAQARHAALCRVLA